MRPTLRLLRLWSAWLVLGLAAAHWGWLTPAWWALGAGLLATSLGDALRLRGRESLEVERQLSEALPLGVWSEVRLRVSNGGPRPLVVDVYDHHPASAEAEGLPRELGLPAGGWGALRYRVRPHERGDHEFGRCELLLRSPAGLWRARVRRGEPQRVRVLPNFRSVAGYALLAVEDRLGQLGIRFTRRRGEGLEFQELREYRRGDSLRRIDWKATSRRDELISRQYEDERNQQLVFLLDCGFRMRTREGTSSHFDHVLNALLLLSYVALRQGDAVGLMTFAGPRRWLPPIKGRVAMSAILRSVYALETSTSSPDYLAAATRLMGHQKRRALVVLLSNLRDEDAPELLPALDLLRRRNLVLLASLREAVLSETLARPVADLGSALTVAATHCYLEARQRAHQRYQARGGVLSLDVEPEQLSIRVVNRYLDIKRGGLL